MVTAASLEGDGLNIPLFQLLWNKDNAASALSSSNANAASSSTTTTPPPQPPLRVPDTVVFQYGQPLHWYFTSRRGGKDGKTVTILRKRKQNVTIEKIEELFLKKAATRGVLGDHDVVAYFIASADCTSRFRRRQSSGSSGVDAGSNGGESDNDDGDSSNTNANDNGDDDTTTTCDIEYFDREGLKAFLAHGRKNQTGILQRFMQPTGGGTHNALIQAIWTPNLCLMERRRTKQSLHDTRFGLYERTVTFEGPDVHSASKPIRGTVLGNRIKHLCNEMVRHVSEVTGADSRKRSRGGSRSRNSATQALAAPAAGQLSRMVVYFKVDVNDDIWVLFTSSLRLDGGDGGGSGGGGISCGNQNALQLQPLLQPLGSSTNTTSSTAAPAPLNINSIVKLGPNIKLNPKANHDPHKILDNEIVLSYCPSCGLDVSDEHFYPVPYKTIISHFEHAIDMMKDELGLERLIEWPPDKQLIEAAGGVGFGSYHLHSKGGTGSGDVACTRSARNAKAVAELPEEDALIPPVIRQIHGRLKVQGYRRYRNDPLFLHRNCNVCEHCFLSYAQLASTSFQMINPVRIDEVERRDRLAAGGRRRQMGREEVEDVDGDDWSEEDDDTDDQSNFFSGHFDSARIHGGAMATSKSIGMLLSGAPTLPPVILEPPKDDNGDYQERLGHMEGRTSINTTHAPLHPRAPPEAINLGDFLAKHMAPPAPPRHPYQPSTGENPRHPLEHLISSYEMMERAKPTQPVPVPRKQQHNPYKVSQRIVDPRGQATKPKPTKGQKYDRKKAADDEIKRNESKVHVEVYPGSVQAKESSTKGTTAKDETIAGSNDNGDSQTRPSVSKLSAEDKQLLTSALSEIYEKQREMTLSQSQLLLPSSESL